MADMSSSSRGRQSSAASTTTAAASYEDPDVPLKLRTNPLPREFWFSMLILWAEPICGTVIYPFINALVRDTGITEGDEAKTGYYAGIIVRISGSNFHQGL